VKTMGIDAVACLAAMTAPVPVVTMTSTLSRLNSVAISEYLSLRPSAQQVLLLTIACDAWDNHSAILLS